MNRTQSALLLALTIALVIGCTRKGEKGESCTKAADCLSGLKCVSQVCVCVPDCSLKNCGDDGCGGYCGLCSTTCSNGLCIPDACTPNCTGKNCGDDGCGGSCGVCAGTDVCNSEGTCGPFCDREKNCEGKNCGPDSCGGLCGLYCPRNWQCIEGKCTCIPNCPEETCTPNGCGAMCGECTD